MNNLVEIRRIGLQTLNDALGPVGMVRFIQQYENGSGDYTVGIDDDSPILNLEIVLKG
jgi:hypothetical protein